MPLVIAATPIGDPGDASSRLRHALATGDVVAAEDTRRVRRLAAALDVTMTGSVVAVYDAVERGRAAALVEGMRSGQTVVLVSDAGMPVVSDPGYLLVAATVAAGLSVTVLPGPSAVTAAVAVSGIAAERFCFEGFLPRKPGDRRRRIAALSRDDRALVVFESPRRLRRTLIDLVAGFGGEREAAVCRELTKTYEEVRRGTLAELAEWAEDHEILGEITVVVAGATATAIEVEDAELARQVEALVTDGSSRRDAVTAVAEGTGVPRRTVYAAATTEKRVDPPQ